jgi:hypothetical protein
MVAVINRTEIGKPLLPSPTPSQRLPAPATAGEGLGMRACVSRAVLLSPDQFADLFFDLVRLRKAVHSVLGENLLPVEEDFK